ncbi:hypothetical protein B9Z55_007060 [Caenorhabditis nigoni]|uniref:Uncharacterized protein n=1 Tax=Caenorhabditis nigoni TaxID=1611254 RepID=A0A2G5V809_9PELO|nr:hypothetical protein B9Z55_007060 [Caenorhabditis nigoni]
MVYYSILMGHESLKTILLHTDPNLRFKIAQRVPKIRLTEKAVPLRIEYLSLDEFRTTVNSQSYTLGVYRHFPTEDIPIRMKNSNDRGGVSWDLDRYGFEIPNSTTPVLNGDVSFRTENAIIIRRDTERVEQHLQVSLRVYENALAKLNQLESEGKTVEEFLAGPMTVDDRRIRLYVHSPKEYLQLRINEFRNDLLPFHYRRNNLSPPFICYIQLTITQGDVRTIQRYLYNQKLYEAAKKFNEILFGNRPVIIVNQLNNMGSWDVWRIPVGLKISAVSISANSGYGDAREIIPISSILDSSKSLRNLSFSDISDPVLSFQHSFVREAEKLSVLSLKQRINMLVNALEKMENQKFHIDLMNHQNPSATYYFQLLQGWMSTERSVDSMLTLGLRTDYVGEEILELVRARNERTESTDRCVTVLRSDATSLQVSYAPLPEEINFSTFLLTARIIKA